MSQSDRSALVARCTSLLARSRWLLGLRSGRRLLARMLTFRRLAARGLKGSLLLVALSIGTAYANGPFLIEPNSDSATRPALIDIDGDGDQDVFVPQTGAPPRLYRNIGTSTQPLLRIADPSQNPFGVQPIGNVPLTFVDIDGDGDQDAFTGVFEGTVRFFRNDGGSFVEMTGAGNPLNGVDVGDASVPSFADIDGDGDQDAIIGAKSGLIHVFENTAAGFVERTGTDNPFNGVDVGSFSEPSFADIDDDGDPDAFVGNAAGTVQFFRNTAGSFSERTGADNPLAGLPVRYAPAFADLDADGDLDLLGGSPYDSAHFFRNVGSASDPRFVAHNPLAGVAVGIESAPAFADLDGDRDLDAVVGSFEGTLRVFRNDNGRFAELTGGANPFDGVDVGENSAPAFVDIDGDTDPDAVVGSADGTLRFFPNAAGRFGEVTGGENPFDGVDVGENSAPAFADLDGDSDPDAFVGSADGTVQYFRNIAGVFASVSGGANPFDGVDVGENSAPTFVDIDGDTDFDAVVGSRDGTLRFFRNTGGETTPLLQPEADSPVALNQVQLSGNSHPVFADIDRDGDQDAFVGSASGAIAFEENLAGPQITSILLPQVWR